MNFAFIMRGIPGSGKSTVAKKLAGETGAIHSNDSYYYENGEYRFDKARVPEVRLQNLKAFTESIQAGIPVVICDSCNLTSEQWGPYTKIASEAGYIVSFVTMPQPDIEISVSRNIHSVPEESIRDMIERWEDLPPKLNL